MRELLDRLILPAFDRGHLSERLDSALLDLPDTRVAMTTDSYVVTPRFFPGGDIGSLAIYGTTNDLAVVGARPLYISVGFILEEGLELEELERVLRSMRQAADRAGVEIVTGDTKVVDRGHGHGMYINTTGLGVVPHELALGHSEIRAGDAVLLSGDLGRHGVAILSVREGLSFETAIESDAAPLGEPIDALLKAGIRVRLLRDLTRGGLSSALNEIALDGRLSIEIDETRVPVDDAVAGACELLGLDPLYVANEGRFVAIIHADDVERALTTLREFPDTRACAHVGRVSATGLGEEGPAPLVVAVTALGPRRVLDLLSGEQLPRIC